MRLFNTQTGEVERFTARDNRVGIYVCGVTPYDTTHAGHAFTFLTFDLLVRYLRVLGHEVTYVQNVTDIDDDILRKAKEVGVTWDALGQRETARFRKDMKDLNALDPDYYLKATEHVAEMVEIAKTLIDKGFAYQENGNVYFEIAKDPEFGKLSHIPRDEMLAVANQRGNTPDDPNKKDPLDFVLWQAAAPDEPTWPSPWGPGRPGWHIECTAMSTKHLGNTIDIHGGGGDLVFPHHECEIAQTESATGAKPFVRYWMHIAMVEYQGEKMSKSLGNLVLASDLLAQYSSDAIRLYLHSHHYRTPWEFHEEEMDDFSTLSGDLREAAEFPAYGVEEEVDVESLRVRFMNALEDDLDAPTAIEALREIGKAILEAPEEDDVRRAQRILRDCSYILGLTLAG